MMTQWESALIEANFTDVCDRLGLDYEQVIDGEYTDDGLDCDDLRDIAFGLGYIRGLADAYDMTSLQVVEECQT